MVSEIENISVSRIHPAFRKNVKVLFNGKRVEVLSNLKLEINNSGSEVVKDPEIIFEFPIETKILNYDLFPKIIGAKFETKNNEFYLKLPFINSFKDHDQKLVLMFIVDGESSFKVNGIGPGWSTKVNYLNSLNKKGKILKWFIYALLPYEIILLWIVIKQQGINFLTTNVNDIKYSASMILILVLMFVPSIFAFIYTIKVIKRVSIFNKYPIF